MQLQELVDRFGGLLEGDGSVEVRGIKGVDEASAGDATFAMDDRVLETAEATDACCVIVPEKVRASNKPLVRSPSPRSLVADLLTFFHPVPIPAPGVHASAVIDESAEVAETAILDANVVVGPRCRVGRAVHLMANVVVGHDCSIDDGSVIHPNVTLYPRTQIGADVVIHSGSVIGADGFGYFQEGGELRKWPHVGNVVIEDGVEIGANACVDRAKFGSTVVQTGAKIDNLVQIAHNCRIGRGVILAGQAGLSGSVVLEDGVVCGGQVGIADHARIRQGAQLAAQAGVMSEVAAGSVEMGSPCRPRRQFLAETALLGFLVEHRTALRKLLRDAGGEQSGERL